MEPKGFRDGDDGRHRGVRRARGEESSNDLRPLREPASRVSRGVSQTARRPRKSGADAGRVGEGVRAFCADDPQLDRTSGPRQRRSQRWAHDRGARRASALASRGEGSSGGKGNLKKSCRLVRSRDRLMAVAQRKPESVIHHSDHGCQYTSLAFGRRCREVGVRPSLHHRSVRCAPATEERGSDQQEDGRLAEAPADAGSAPASRVTIRAGRRRGAD